MNPLAWARTEAVGAAKGFEREQKD